MPMTMARLIALAVLAVPCRAEMPSGSAYQFTDSIGVTTHFGYGTDTVYGSDYTNVKARLLALGIRHIRDTATTNPDVVRYFTDLIASGVRIDAMFYYTLYPTGAIGPFLTAVPGIFACENTNEPDVTPGGNSWKSTVTAMLFGIYSACHWAGLPVYGPSVGKPSNIRALGNTASYADFSNVHPYYWPGLMPENSINGLQPYLSAARTYTAPGKPVVVTETGYCIYGTMSDECAGVDQAAEAVYVLRTAFYHWNKGLAATYFYELLSLASEGFKAGLLDVDETPFAQYTALRNLTMLLSDSNSAVKLKDLGLFAANPRLWGNLQHTLLQKTDRSYWLAIWQAASVWNTATHADIPVNPVSLGLRWIGPNKYRVYTFGSDGTVTDGGARSGQSVTLSISAAITLLKINASGAAAFGNSSNSLSKAGRSNR